MADRAEQTELYSRKELYKAVRDSIATCEDRQKFTGRGRTDAEVMVHDIHRIMNDFSHLSLLFM